MAKFRIEYNRDTCIGAAPCTAAAPEYFTVDQGGDGKADLVASTNPTINGPIQILDIEEENLQKALDAAQVCPVKAIKVTNLETGEVLFPTD